MSVVDVKCEVHDFYISDWAMKFLLKNNNNNKEKAFKNKDKI